MSIYPKQIKDALAKVRYPGTGKDLVTAGMVEDNIRIEGNKVSFSLLFEKENDPFMKSVIKAHPRAGQFAVFLLWNQRGLFLIQNGCAAPAEQ